MDTQLKRINREQKIAAAFRQEFKHLLDNKIIYIDEEMQEARAIAPDGIHIGFGFIWLESTAEYLRRNPTPDTW